MTQANNPLHGLVTFHMKRRTLAATSGGKRIFRILTAGDAVEEEHTQVAANFAVMLSHTERLVFAEDSANWTHPELIAIRDFWAWWEEHQAGELDAQELWRWRLECLGEVTMDAWNTAFVASQFTGLHNPRELHPASTLTEEERADPKS